MKYFVTYRGSNNRVRELFFGFLLTIIMFVSISLAQENRPFGMPGADLPHFFLDILNFPSDSANIGRIDVYVQVPYEMLSFVKSEDQFRSSYEVTIDVFDTKANLVTEKLWTESIITNDYKESVSPLTGKISQRTLLLSPDTYNFMIQIRDVETKKISQIKRTVIVRDLASQSLAMSDVMVVNKMENDGARTAVVPNIAGSVKGGEMQIPFYFEALTKNIPLDVMFILSIQSKVGITIRSDTLTKTLKKSRQSCFINVIGNSLLAGEYSVEVKAMVKDSADPAKQKVAATVSRKLFVKLEGLPVTVNDLDMAIEQLQYIAQKEVLDEMRNAVGEKKRELFMQFWKQRDPTAGTEVNELMIEYYQRVDYANKNFTHYTDGWKSDRGNVYIVFGEPNNIERHPFDADSKPYEIWTYYEMNKEFVFVDDSGFGDYRLRNPLWDVWRTRNR